MTHQNLEEKGTLSIHTENIFPIIKKFLYADQEVFLRELISNAVDATQKLLKLSALGKYKGDLSKSEELRIRVQVNATARTLTVSDAGVGMTADEVKEYINQIAFSGATAFVEKYKEAKQSMIGHFGLGFYSAFMVADTVELHTYSCQDEATPTFWRCKGNTSFEIGKTVKKNRGTDVILHLSEDAKEFLEKDKIKSILKKYCQFLPVEIEFEGEIINQTHPIWTQTPTSLKKEDYIKFYERLYPGAPEPLFWIHLHVDYPFELNGILYFPQLGSNFSPEKHYIHLYARQVFITDEVGEVVPPFLQLLHGVLDSPDIPLNVSRSTLQSDAQVKKIHAHITKKVADKLEEYFKEDRRAYEKAWRDIGLFVKYGMCSEEKFYERAQKFCLLSNTEGKFFTLDTYKNQIKSLQIDKKKNYIFLYATDQEAQYALIEQAKSRGYDVLLLDSPIDTHFINHLDAKCADINFKRLDAASIDTLIDTGTSHKSLLSKSEEKILLSLFEELVKQRQGHALPVRAESLSEQEKPVSILVPEFMRRMQEMAASQGTEQKMPESFEVAINTNHPLSIKLAKEKSAATQQLLAKELYDLALLTQQKLRGASLNDFIERQLLNLAPKASTKPSKEKK